MKKYIYIIISLIVIILLYFIFYTNRLKEYSKNMFYMDTYINVKIYSNKDKKNIDKIYDSVALIYDEYNRLCDAYKEYDEYINIYYLNNILKNDEAIEIDKKLYDLINYGIHNYEKTNGYVNIALGNVTLIWKDYMNEGINIPSYENLSKQNTNIKDIILNDGKFMKKNNIKIDVGAIAKGYVTEKVGKYLSDNKIDKYLINAGGNIKVGNHYNNSKYIIGIEDPTDTNNIYQKINVNNKSIVTSGDYQRYYVVDDIKYNHIINPKTLYPSNNFKSVTVITEDSGYADILSTYLFLLPINDALDYVNNNDLVEAIFYIDEYNIVKSEGFSKYE